MQTELSQSKKRQAEDETEIVNRIQSAAMTSNSTPTASDCTSMSDDEAERQRPVKQC